MIFMSQNIYEQKVSLNKCKYLTYTDGHKRTSTSLEPH